MSEVLDGMKEFLEVAAVLPQEGLLKSRTLSFEFRVKYLCLYSMFIPALQAHVNSQTHKLHPHLNLSPSDSQAKSHECHHEASNGKPTLDIATCY